MPTALALGVGVHPGWADPSGLRAHGGRHAAQAEDTRAPAWSIATLGPQTSVDVDAAVPLELLRRGMRSRGLLGLVATAPPATGP
jgi:hypothetical protein